MEQTFISFEKICYYWCEHIAIMIKLNSQIDEKLVSKHNYYDTLEDFINNCERHYSFNENIIHCFKENCKIETFREWYNKQ